MCANYVPVTRAERLLQFFGVVRGIDEPTRDVFASGFAPFLRLAPDGTDSGELVRTVADGIFRFVPDFIAKVEWARNTYNARAETVDTKFTYKMACAQGHRMTAAIYMTVVRIAETMASIGPLSGDWVKQIISPESGRWTAWPGV